MEWTFKYEPQNFDDMILDSKLRPILKKKMDNLDGSMILYGSAGVGKGTFTNILIKHTGYDHLWINASDETGIDTIRMKVKEFATAMSITPLKIVVLNEADSLSTGKQGAQKILKQLMEDVHAICKFIYLTNDFSGISDELKSRCLCIKIDNPPAKEIFLMACKILKNEKIKFEKKTVLSIVKKCYPDIRSVVLTLQNNTVDGKLLADFITASEPVYKEIMKSMLEKDVEQVRKLLRSNYINYTDLYKYLYDNAGEFSSPGGAILLIGDHLRDDPMSAIKEINFMHMVFEMIHTKAI